MHASGTLALFVVLSVCTWCYGAEGAGKDMAAPKDPVAMHTRGMTIAIKDGIYCAFEFSHNVPKNADALNQIALEFGLEQKIQPPGSQRNSLSRE